MSTFADFKRLLERFPANSIRWRCTKTHVRIEKPPSWYDLAAFDFYLRREAWIAAIKQNPKSCKDTQIFIAARKSLKIQLEAYEQLGLEDAVKRTKRRWAQPTALVSESHSSL